MEAFTPRPSGTAVQESPGIATHTAQVNCDGRFRGQEPRESKKRDVARGKRGIKHLCEVVPVWFGLQASSLECSFLLGTWTNNVIICGLIPVSYEPNSGSDWAIFYYIINHNNLTCSDSPNNSARKVSICQFAQ